MPYRAPQRAFSVIPRRILIYTSPDLDNGRSKRYNARKHKIIRVILNMACHVCVCMFKSSNHAPSSHICLEGVVFTVHTGLHVQVSAAYLLLQS